MLADVAQSTDGNGSAGRVDGYAAAIGVSDRYNIVYSGVAREYLGTQEPGAMGRAAYPITWP